MLSVSVSQTSHPDVCVDSKAWNQAAVLHLHKYCQMVGHSTAEIDQV